jgi:hypothetical protein
MMEFKFEGGAAREPLQYDSGGLPEENSTSPSREIARLPPHLSVIVAAATD